MSTTRGLLEWVKEQIPVLKTRVAETHAVVERSRVDDKDPINRDCAQDSKESCRAA